MKKVVAEAIKLAFPLGLNVMVTETKNYHAGGETNYFSISLHTGTIIKARVEVEGFSDNEEQRKQIIDGLIKHIG